MASQQSQTQDLSSTHNTATAENLYVSEENQDETGLPSRIEIPQSIHFGRISTDEQIAIQSEPIAMNTLGSDDERGRTGLTQQSNVGQLEKILRDISGDRKLLQTLHAGHPCHYRLLHRLAERERYHFQLSQSITSINDAIHHGNDAVLYCSQNTDERSMCLGSLGGYYYFRFQRLGAIGDIDKAIECLRSSLALVPDWRVTWPELVSNLALSWSCRFERLGDLSDLRKAIGLLRKVIAVISDEHADKPPCLTSLGASLDIRFQRFGNLEDIDECIKVQKQAVELTPHGHEDMPGRLANLGISLIRRFERLGNLENVDESIKVLQQVVELTPHGHADMPGRLANLGLSLIRRFERLGSLQDVDESIKVRKQAVELTPHGHADMPGHLTNLGLSLIRRFERLGNLENVDESIKVLQQVVELTPHGHADMPGHLTNLGLSLIRRFERLGNLEDVDECIKVQRQAVELTPHGHEDMPGRLNNLGGSLMRRFERLGNLEDIEESIKVRKQAVELTPHGHADMRAILSNLGDSVMRRFERLGNLEDVDESIKVRMRALELTPHEHTDIPVILNALGCSLMRRFERLGNLEDVDESIKVHKQAVELTPHGHAAMPGHLKCLGGSLMHRFHRLGNLEDVDESIKALQQAVELTPHGHADMPSRLRTLGHSFYLRFDSSNNHDDLRYSLNAYQESALSSYGPPSIRFDGAKFWALTYRILHGTPLVEAHQTALSLVPQIIWLGTDITHRYKEIASIGDTINDATAEAILLGRHDLAMEWLEQGRSIVWGQILNLRTPLDNLRASSPELARRLTEVSYQLETAGTSRPDTAVEPSKIDKASLEQQAQNHHRLAAEYEEVLLKVRKLPGFGSFLKPKQLSELRLAAQDGPVTVINVTDKRCDALVLRDDNMPVLHIPLPDLTLGIARAMCKTFVKRLKDSQLRSRDSEDRASIKYYAPGQEPMQHVLEWLWRTVVCPIMVRVHEEWPDAPLHMTWCATGPLALLPLHAAGLYRSPNDIKLYDFTVSSYTPSLTMLIEAHRHSSPGVSPDTGLPRILAISQPNTPTQHPLPGTKTEISDIKSSIGGRASMTWLNDTDATVSATLEAMKTHDWCHFACHGIQHPENPTESAFMLHDGPLTLHTMMKQTFSSAHIAFLSACQTATGDENLTEESVHLAAGMLVAGYSTVFGTLWSIMDQDAPLVAKEVYKHLLEEKDEGIVGNHVRGAYALHEATKRLREVVGENAVVRWVPFVHFGV